jgi:aspartate ammonia-lyase
MQRSLEHCSIGQDLIPREMITAYAILKKAAANANHAGGRLDERAHRLIAQAVRPRRRSGEDGTALLSPGYKQVEAATCI